MPNVIVQTDKAIWLPNKTLTHTNPKHPLQYFVYHSFSDNENLCIVNCLKFYTGERNKRMDGNHGRLMITYLKSHKETSSDTLSTKRSIRHMITYLKSHKEASSDTLSTIRSIKGELSNARIDVIIFQTHSCKAASASKSRQQGIKIS